MLRLAGSVLSRGLRSSRRARVLGGLSLALLLAGTGSAEAAAAAQAPSAPPEMGATVPNRFDKGSCTWYVASLRKVTWTGNANEWWQHAAVAGYAEGRTPDTNAIMVTREGPVGHVALVTAVNADGTWTVSEMAFRGTGRVTTRTLRPGQAPVVGFIYGKT
jgi:surface antigen